MDWSNKITKEQTNTHIGGRNSRSQNMVKNFDDTHNDLVTTFTIFFQKGNIINQTNLA